MKYSPKYFNEFKKRYPGVARSFDQLGAECAKAGPSTRRRSISSNWGSDCVGPRGQCAEAGKTCAGRRRKPGCQSGQAVLLSTTTAGFPTMLAAHAMGGRGHCCQGEVEIYHKTVQVFNILMVNEALVMGDDVIMKMPVLFIRTRSPMNIIAD